MPINSGYSFYEYAGDGVTTRFPIQFSLGELKRAYVTCRVDNEVDAFGAPLYRALSDVPGDPGMIEVLGAVPDVGAPIVFRRIVPKELLLHLYANGSILDYPSLDESHLQLMMALHEVLDGYGLTNVFTDINMNGYKLTNVYSDPDDPDSIATVAFLGTYRQDALDAAIAAADSALEALGYRNAAQVLANAAGARANDSAASALVAEGWADAAALHSVASSDFADASEQSALDAVAAVSGLDARVSALETDVPALELIVDGKLNKDENINLGVSVPASGTAIDFVGIPEGVKRITVMFYGVSTNGTSPVCVRLGGVSILSTGYAASASRFYTSSVATVNFTTGFGVNSGSAGDRLSGQVVLSKGTNRDWLAMGAFGGGPVNSSWFVGGSVSLPDRITQIRVTTENGTDQFDAGTINISWEL